MSNDDIDYPGLIHAMACDNVTEGDSHRYTKAIGPAVQRWFDEHDAKVRQRIVKNIQSILSYLNS